MPRHQVFRLSVRLQDELWSCGILILVASTNLRARYSPILLATDASLDWEAGVKAQVGERFGEEPEAQLSAAGLLEASEELPGRKLHVILSGPG